VKSKLLFIIAWVLVISTLIAADYPQTLETQREEMIKQMEKILSLTSDQVEKLRNVINGSKFIGQGNPAKTVHPVTTAQCLEKMEKENISFENPEFEKICGAKYMSPLYDPATEKPEDAKACIDQFEFPNIPCAYALTYAQAYEAVLLCKAVGKRICDAHEWEGGCDGALLEPDYRFDLGVPSAMRNAHNAKWGKTKKYAYGGSKYKRGICGGGGSKTPGCGGISYYRCGSNTYPSGYFTDCKSTLGVYDQHGNAAEHMNLPLAESQMASKGSTEMGVTEMKGSWWIFDKGGHPDWCRWRAPYWHGTKVMSKGSHRNYHLGLRCCKTLNK
jgi:hypothetical protein